MLTLILLSGVVCSSDRDPLITQEMVDKINNNPRSSFKAKLNPRFAGMTVADAKRMLRPVPENVMKSHGSPRPVGSDENHYASLDKRVFTGFYKTDGTAGPHTSSNVADQTDWTTSNKYKYVVYDNRDFCASWAPAVTSAMSLALSIHHKRFVNLSVQFILDCDLLNDPCMERPPLNAYEQFWRRYIPQFDRWDQPSNILRTPYNGTEGSLTKEICDQRDGCYPGWTNCPRNLVLTGTCEPGETNIHCPIYPLYNWRWIKSHLWEVGPVTSSVLVRQTLFTYDSGVYSAVGINSEASNAEYTSNDMTDVIGMLDVTIIGWGQEQVNLSSTENYKAMFSRWWYVIPHLGAFGESCESIFGDIEAGDSVSQSSILDYVQCDTSKRSGIMRWNRRFDDSGIESQAVGAVPYNFVPKPYRTPKPA